MYDDRVVVAYFDQMWEVQGCSSNMATAGRAHPNVQTTLALIKQSSVDYRTQLDIAVDAAFANNFSAGASIANAGSGMAIDISALLTGIASGIETYGATSGAAVSAGLGIALDVVDLALAITNQVLTANNYAAFQTFRNNFDSLVNDKLNPLYTDVQADVQRSGAFVFSDQ